jgi:hypothetical protein
MKFYMALVICQLHAGGNIQCEFYVFVNKVLNWCCYIGMLYNADGFIGSNKLA